MCYRYTNIYETSKKIYIIINISVEINFLDDIFVVVEYMYRLICFKMC